jgi:hypothetical protein
VYITDLLIWSFTITANGVFVTVLEIGLIWILYSTIVCLQKKIREYRGLPLNQWNQVFKVQVIKNLVSLVEQ